MKQSTQTLQDTIKRINGLLEQDSFFSLTSEDLHSLKPKIADISDRLRSIEGIYLTVGILGGTGVGKSTLMNALAGAEIAASSHRRPHTDQALLYRHADASVHHVGAIKSILLCDLPDFDSLLEQHRNYVIDFINHLDVLVWVVSPEKYADSRFYEFLRMVPKSGRNYYFVLNKADLLFTAEEPAPGHERLANVTSRFQAYLKENGVQNPLIYALTALSDRTTGPDRPQNQLNAFKHVIFQHRDIKQITQIKVANLDAEIRRVLAVFHKEAASLESLGKTLTHVVRELRDRGTQWREAGQYAIDLWLETRPFKRIWARHFDPSRLVGPGYAVGLLFKQWEKPVEAQSTSWEEPAIPFPQEAEIQLKSQLEWLENRINHQIGIHDPTLHVDRHIQNIFNASDTLEAVKNRLTQTVAARTAVQTVPLLWGFKFRQYVTYALLFLMFCLGIGGETAWQEVLYHPGIRPVLQMFLSFIQTLFSAKGVAALVSYALLNLYFGVRFYRSYQNRLRRAARKLRQRIRAELQAVWADTHQAIVEDLQDVEKNLQIQLAHITSLISRQ